MFNFENYLSLMDFWGRDTQIILIIINQPYKIGLIKCQTVRKNILYTFLHNLCKPLV